MTEIGDKTRYMYLFNDIMVCTFDNMVHRVIPLQTAIVDIMPDTGNDGKVFSDITVALKNRWRVEAEGGSYVFICSTPNERGQWLTDILNQVNRTEN